MIYTVTLNPSLDYIVSLDSLTLGRVNRTNKEQILPGGKGINVSIVLKNLGFPSTALGFTAGFTGDEIERELQESGCLTDFIRVSEGFSRINIKIKSKEETELNGRGPVIGVDDLKAMFEKTEKLVDGDILVLAGSIPGLLPSNIYSSILERLTDKNIKVIVDATGNLLVNALQYGPFLIKPNIYELSEIFQKPLQGNDEIIHYAKKLQGMGAKNVLVSMGGDGAILVSEDGQTYQSEAPKGKLVSSVGSGDSMVAGFIAGHLLYADYKEAFRMGISAGSATAFSSELATKKEIMEVWNKLDFSMKL